MHPRRGAGDRLYVVDALRRFQDGVNQNWFFDFVACFDLRQQLVKIMNVPGAVDLGQHDDVELVADRAHDFDTSSSAQGELSALMRVHNPVAPYSTAFAIRRAFAPGLLASIGIASSRLPSTTSTWRANSGTLARSLSRCGGTKWIMRSSRTGSSRMGVGAPIARGTKNWRGSFRARSFQKAVLPFTGRKLSLYKGHFTLVFSMAYEMKPFNVQQMSNIRGWTLIHLSGNLETLKRAQARGLDLTGRVCVAVVGGVRTS